MVAAANKLAANTSQEKPDDRRELVLAGLERCRELDAGAAIVLGHASYYPRFGFKTSTCFGIHPAFDVPEEAFMAMELQFAYLKNRSGIVRYHPAFDGV